MSKQSRKNYIVARRYAKHYIADNNEAASKAGAEQRFYLSDDDLEALKGKRVLLVDNMVRTGESLRGLEALVKKAGGIAAAKVAVLAEGEAANRNDILFLEKLPASSSK